MRDLIVTQNITLDGVIEAVDDWFGPAAGRDDVADVEAALRDQRERADTFLTGRTTFEAMRSHWHARPDDPTGISAYLDRVAKAVVSRTLGNPRWERTTVLRGDLAADIGALKAAPGRDIVTTGSITLVHALIAADLVDEFRLFTYPVVLGRGRCLFERPPRTPLVLAEARAFRSGIVLLRYRRR